jgi:hypothetical protein
MLDDDLSLVLKLLVLLCLFLGGGDRLRNGVRLLANIVRARLY